MGRSAYKNKRRRKSIKNSSDSFHDSFYYPIYTGWVANITPIFESASAAICYQISRYKRDLLDHNTAVQPAWFDCVGSIHPDDFKGIESYVFQTNSTIEESYFENINFYKIKECHHARSTLVRITNQTFVSCLNTMKEYTDYQSSSTSIYKQGSFCVEEHNVKSIDINFDRNGISQKRDPNNNNLITLSLSGKKLLSDPNIRSVEHIMKKLINVSKSYKGDKLVVSFGAGSGLTELSSEILCLCVDTNRRSVFTGLCQVKGKKASNLTVFAVMNFSENMDQLLLGIKKAIPNLTIRVLLQHPSPSIVELNQNNMKQLFSSLRMTMESVHIKDVTFVYDYCNDRNTLSRESILELFNNKVERDRYSATEENGLL